MSVSIAGAAGGGHYLCSSEAVQSTMPWYSLWVGVRLLSLQQGPCWLAGAVGSEVQPWGAFVLQKTLV